MSGEAETPSQTLHLVVGPSAPESSGSSVGRFFAGIRSVLELTAKLLPGLALIVAILAFRGEFSDYFRHASKIEIFGLKLEKGEFDRRLEEARGKGPPASTPNQPWLGEVAFRKLRLAAPLLNGLRVLWVDDNPQNNFELRRILTDFGVLVTVALHNAEAIAKIQREDYDVLISDFGRDSKEPNGGDLARELRYGLTPLGESRSRPVQYPVPILFYTSRPENIPDDVPRDGATNNPAQLLSDVAEFAFARRE